MQFKCPPYLEQKDIQNHKKLLEALAAHPEDAVWLHSLLLHACFPGVDHDQCISSADYLLQHTADKELLFWANYLKGSVLEHRKKPDEAIPLFKKVLELEPETQQALASLAVIYLNRKQFDESLKYYHALEALALQEAEEDGETFSDDSLYADIAEAYFLKKDYENALAYFQKALDIKKDSATAINGFGRVAASKGENDKALDYFARALKLHPNDAYIYYYIGHTWQNKQDLYRAMHNYTEALKLKPDFPEVYNNIAALCMNEEGDVKGAIDNMMTALEHTAKDSLFLITVYRNLSLLYATIADYDKSEYYKMKMMQAMGFPVEMEGGEDDGMEETE